MSGLERHRGGLPENLGRRGSVEIGGMSKEELQQRLKTHLGSGLSRWAEDLLNSENFTVAEQPERIELVCLTVAELGFPKGARTEEIFQAAQQRGLELCPAEVGPRLRMQADTEQTLGEWFVVAMKPIIDFRGRVVFFSLGQHAGKPGLLTSDAGGLEWWFPGVPFVFRLRKEPSDLKTL